MSKNEKEFNQQVCETLKSYNEILRIKQGETKQFRVVCENDIISDWFYCKDFTIDLIQLLAKRFNDYGDWYLEFKEV